MYVLSTVAGAASEQLRPHYLSLIDLCAKSLQDQENNMVAFYAIQLVLKLALSYK